MKTLGFLQFDNIKIFIIDVEGWKVQKFSLNVTKINEINEIPTIDQSLIYWVLNVFLNLMANGDMELLIPPRVQAVVLDWGHEHLRKRFLFFPSVDT